ncbi:MAG: MCE family protein [Betaproteobacteria bacterium]|nr:MCE family protein [Betaproteobacteria bacterium]
MESKVNYIVVGAFVLVLGTALIGGVLWLSSEKSYRKTYDTYLTYMSESVAGLSLYASVKYRGVEVGRVRKIALAAGNVEKVELTLDIERGTPVKVDTLAVLRTHGLTGIAYVELSGSSRDSKLLEAGAGEEYPTIRSGASLMVRLDSAITTLLANLNLTSEGVNALMDEDNRRAFKQTVADLQVLSRTLAARAATIDAGLADAARAAKNTAQLTAELPKLTERMQKSADALDRMAAEVARASAAAGSVVAGARPDVQRFTAETLPEAHLLVAELRELTGTLRRFSEELERNPAQLLYGKPPSKPGPGE